MQHARQGDITKKWLKVQCLAQGRFNNQALPAEPCLGEVTWYIWCYIHIIYSTILQLCCLVDSAHFSDCGAQCHQLFLMFKLLALDFSRTLLLFTEEWLCNIRLSHTTLLQSDFTLQLLPGNRACAGTPTHWGLYSALTFSSAHLIPCENLSSSGKAHSEFFDVFPVFTSDGDVVLF